MAKYSISLFKTKNIEIHIAKVSNIILIPKIIPKIIKLVTNELNLYILTNESFSKDNLTRKNKISNNATKENIASIIAYP